ncbi:MAG: outer membrane protein [Rhodoblastus sp.]
MKKFLLAATMVASSFAAAQAADLPSRKMAPPPAVVYSPASVYSWTGFYVGASIGYGWMDNFNRAGSIGFGPGGKLQLESPHGGIVVGPQVGFNYQISPMFVAGVEADWQGSSVGGGVVGRRTPWFATLRGRLGVTPFNPSLMVYATGGFAFGDLRIGPFPLPPGGTISQVATGWTLGGGLEYAFAGNWSAKLEYLYTNIGANFANPFVFGATASQRVREQTIRLGVNYHFYSTGSAPVLARY